MDAEDAEPTDALSSAEFDDLPREVLARVRGVLDEQTRLRLLLDAVIGIAADHTLDGVLDRIVRTASTLLDARYAALGVLGLGQERRLRTFVHHGLSDEAVARIGEFPRGHGLLGMIIDRPEPLRLHDITEHPAYYGFPPNHPPMRSFLGVPVRIRGQVFGNLYLTEKAGDGDFTEQDERTAVALATAAGVAVENANLHEEAARREQWLEATAEITAALSGSETGSDALETVTNRARQVAHADVAWIVAGADVSELRIQAVSGAPISDEQRTSVTFDSSLARLVVEKGEPMSVENLHGDPRSRGTADLDGWPRLGPAIVVPIRLGTGTAGVLALAWTEEHAHDYPLVDASMPASFAEHAALALELARAREDQQRLAVVDDRERIGRDLHDLVIQRLFAVGLGLQGAARIAEQPDVTERLERAVDDLDATIKDIRRTIFALGAPDGAADIQSEATRLVERARSTLKFRPVIEFDGPVRSLVSGDLAADVLAALGEALSNASRHAEATRVDVRLAAGDQIVLTVADNGRGLPSDFAESGLANIRARANRRGGSVMLAPGPERGTRLVWSVPSVPA